MEVWGGNALVDSGVVMAGLDAWVYSKPYMDAAGGGDVYYVSSCATGRINRLLVADVSGHGEDVSELAITLRTLMRKYVNFIDQTRFVKQMNHQFVELAKEGLFATALVTTFFGPTKELSLCNAGHPPPLIYRAKTGTWLMLEPTTIEDTGRNIPLGILDLDDYAQFVTRLELNDLVLCYTDSLIESKDQAGDFLGTGGLLQTIAKINVTDPARLVHTLLEAISHLHPGNLSDDDVTTLLFRPNGLGSSIPLTDRLLAPWRILKSMFSSGTMSRPELSIANIGGAILNPLSHVRKRLG